MHLHANGHWTTIQHTVGYLVKKLESNICFSETSPLIFEYITVDPFHLCNMCILASWGKPPCQENNQGTHEQVCAYKVSNQSVLVSGATGVYTIYRVRALLHIHIHVLLHVRACGLLTLACSGLCTTTFACMCTTICVYLCATTCM